MANAIETLVLGGGCFWCLEGAFKVLPGVQGIVSGYAGGSAENPSYEEVCSGETGHAEVVRVDFDPTILAMGRLFDLFFVIHDPTTRDRQGADVGPQYRSIVLYADEGQKAAALEAMARARAGREAPIVTEILPLGDFWPAEAYHQDFFAKNPNYGYCRAVVAPKIKKALAFAATQSRPATEWGA
ncbi:MAG TPA: peptide-methionine (S)-S-oxide reductase MsrA [Rectinemataceae bacterium]|nr:peptide-methionine (S)-S-oxide reductase MsrA [Rectinemataceae bacterium]